MPKHVITRKYLEDMKREDYRQRIASGALKKPVIKRSELITAVSKLDSEQRDLVRLGLYEIED